MTNLGNGWFTFNVMENDDPEEPCAPIDFSIELDEIPEVMRFNESMDGYYLDQIKWTITGRAGDLSAPHEIVIDIHGDINPAYNAALMSLFGDEVGRTLLMKSEAYLAARRSNLEKSHAEDERYIGDLAIARDVVKKMSDVKLAKQVFGRIMTSSTFI